MQNQIERLRAERNAAYEGDKVEGLKDGRDWALNSEWTECRKLASIDTDELASQVAYREATFSEMVVGIMEADDEETLFGSTDLSDAYVTAFIQGAREIMLEVAKG